MSKNDEKYAAITGALVALIEKGGLLPWQKPWKAAEAPRSMSSNKLYRGINHWILSITADVNGWSPWFGTYKQIEALGGQVRKGEKSTMVVLWKPVTTTDANGDDKTFFMLRTFNVFSASQADNLPEKFYAAPTEAVEVPQDAQEVFDGYVTREGIPVVYGGSSALYTPALDQIKLPNVDSFLSGEHFFATAFHEAAHSTGAEKRLAREGVMNIDGFGSHQYSREELVAEFASTMVLGTLGLDKPNIIDNQAAYLAHWVSHLKDDPQALIWAAGRAEKAADMILGASPDKEEVAA